jgi:hypothetical protein
MLTSLIKIAANLDGHGQLRPHSTRHQPLEVQHPD